VCVRECVRACVHVVCARRVVCVGAHRAKVQRFSFAAVASGPGWISDSFWIYLYVCMYSIYVCVLYIYMCVYKYIYIYTCIYIYIYICMYMCVHYIYNRAKV
jgi:hypothetical protein